MKLNIFLITTLVIILITSCSIGKQEFQINEDVLYKVVRIVDGDTYVLEDDNGTKDKIRIIGADTPETKHPKKGLEPFGNEATAFAQKYLTNKVVRLKFEKEKRDRYKRVLAHVYINGVHFNKMLIDSGLAKSSFYYPNYKYIDAFEKAEEIANSNSLGIWSEKKK